MGINMMEMDNKHVWDVYEKAKRNLEKSKTPDQIKSSLKYLQLWAEKYDIYNTDTDIQIASYWKLKKHYTALMFETKFEEIQNIKIN